MITETYILYEDFDSKEYWILRFINEDVINEEICRCIYEQYYKDLFAKTNDQVNNHKTTQK